MPKRAFTVETPVTLEATKEGEHWWVETDGRKVRLSNLDKLYWKNEGYTKGDLLAYYFNVAGLILPHLAGRPLTLKRMPDGADGPHFYEKNAPSHTPDWVPRCRVQSEDAQGGVIDYLTAPDTACLLFVANLGAIEFHPLHSKCDTIELPDYLFFDLDPFEPATFSDVLAVAHHVKAALDALGLPSYPKTSGATGMQIYVPIEHGPTYREVRDFVAAVGRAIRAVDRDRVTMEWEISKRTGKVFIDHNMNRAGANIAAVYSVRPEPGASVSTPVTWDEVAAGEIRPQHFTIETAHERFAEVGNLFEGLLTSPVDVRPALEAMGVRPDGEDERPTLATYRAKRDFTKTNEPPPVVPDQDADAPRFVIQKHNATRLHYDLRLEREGVLASWAVPKGLPMVPGTKHLAVQTEDHPIEYLDFHGIIPEGQYGAGEMIIFDTGTYEPLEWEKSKLTFRLHGKRHRGEYHLVKTRESWLIFLSSRSEPLPPPPNFMPMLAEGGHQPFSQEGWRFEPKLDGIRTLARVTPEGTALWSRTGRDQTSIYPELANLATHVDTMQAVLDGEIVALTKDGRPSFELLQQRMNLTNENEIARARQNYPVVLYAFDLLWHDGEDLTPLPLEQRRSRLESIVTEGPVRLTHYVDEYGEQFFAAAKQLSLEGVVAKRLGSVYRSGQRSPDWRKIKAVRRQDCVILGWTSGSGSRSSTLGALLVGAYDGDELKFIGQVGTGFTQQFLDQLLERLEGVKADRPAAEIPAQKAKGTHWTRPELVCEVEYLEMTKGGRLRAPSFKGLRPDKTPGDCLLEPPVSL